MTIYYNGKYVQKSEVSISPDDRGFLFADGIYEVIRAYEGHLFRLADHLKRLASGLKALGIRGVEPAEIGKVAARLVNEDGLRTGDATVYVQITRGPAPRSHKFPPPTTPPTVYVEAKTFSAPLKEPSEGAATIIVADQRWARCDLKTTGLLANTLAHQRAFEAGAFEAIFCRDGMLLEGTHSSVLFVKEGMLIAPPLTNYILPGVTRQVVMELAQSESIPVAIRSCPKDEMAGLDEVLMLGTTVEVTPVTKVDGLKIAGGEAGPVTRKLQKAFAEAVRRERGAA
jgi:D-alanine transaminase